MSNEIKHIKVRRIKDEKKMKHLKIKRINVPESVEDVIKIKIVRFKKEYDEFLKLTGECPDEFVNNVSNSIALLYFKYRQGYNKYKVKEELNTIPYNKYIKLFMEIGYHKMELMNISVKFITGANILYNLLSRLIAVDDLKIKMDVILEDFYYAIYRNRIFYRGIQGIEKFNVTSTMERMFAIKENTIIAAGEEIEKCKDLKGSVIMVEYNYRKQFIAIPYRFYKKLLNIKHLSIEFIVIADPAYNCFNDEFENMTVDEIDHFDEIYSYGNQVLSSCSLTQHVHNIMEFENYMEFLSKHDAMAEEGLNVIKDRISVFNKNGTFKEMDYNTFVKEYLMFLRI